MLDFCYLHPNTFLTDSPKKYQAPSISVDYRAKEKVMELKCLGLTLGSTILGNNFSSL